MSQLLSDNDLIELSGCKSKTAQIQWLNQQGINFYIRKDGRPSITWYMVNNPFAHKNISASSEPDFGAM